MARSDKTEIDKIKSSQEYLNLVEECNVYIRGKHAKGLIISFLKAQKPELLAVLAKDVSHIRLLSFASTALREMKKDQIISQVNLEPATVKALAMPKPSLVSVLQFNVNVLLPAIVALKKAEQGDRKSLTALLNQQSPENLEKLRKIDPKRGVLSAAMAKELRSKAEDAIIDNIKQLTEAHLGMLETPAIQTVKQRGDNKEKLQQFKSKFPDLVEDAYQKLKGELEKKLHDYKTERAFMNKDAHPHLKRSAEIAVSAVNEHLKIINAEISNYKSGQPSARTK